VIRTVYRSEDYTVRDRVDAWADITSRSIMPMALDIGDPAAFTATLGQAALGPAALTNMLFSPHRAARTKPLIRRADPEAYVLVHLMSGTLGVSQDGQESAMGAGDLTVFDSSTPLESVVGAGGEMTESLLLHIPRTLMPLPPRSVERLLAARLPGQRGLGAGLAGALTSVRAEAEHCTPADAARLGGVLFDLFTAFVAHHLDADDAVPADSRRVALLRQIDAYVQQRLGDPELTPAAVAAAHHISTRYLHRLFQDRDTTVAAFIRGQRLERCRRDLADPALGRLPIRAIAARWGFAHPADFSRAFRAAYGTPPRDYRHGL
jgi:AraC-like DNA-binding protein